MELPMLASIPWVELIAASIGALSVYWMTQQKPAAWPTGLVMVLMYIWIFYDARLYSEMLLQMVYVVMQGYGWWQWLRGGKQQQGLVVSSLGTPGIGQGLLIGTCITLALGLTMSQYTDANLPWLDASLTGFSLVAQYWMAKKRLQCWLLWMVLDVIYVGMFVTAGLYLTAVLYLFFTALAVHGWREWRLNLNVNLHLKPGLPA